MTSTPRTEKSAVPVEPLSEAEEAALREWMPKSTSPTVATDTIRRLLATLDAARSLPPDEDGLRAALDAALDALDCDSGGDGYVNHDIDVAWPVFRAALGAAPVEDET
jgi:hypothetical protein